MLFPSVVSGVWGREELATRNHGAVRCAARIPAILRHREHGPQARQVTAAANSCRVSGMKRLQVRTAFTGDTDTLQKDTSLSSPAAQTRKQSEWVLTDRAVGALFPTAFTFPL